MSDEVDRSLQIIDRRKAKPDFVNHFLPRELEMVKSIKHPNVIRTMKVRSMLVLL